MAYLTELRVHWRPLLGATIGLGSGLSIGSYTNSIIAPSLLAEFGWTKAEFALVSALTLLAIVALPIVGRLTDVLGVRLTALIGVIILPITFIALSFQTGDIRLYAALYVVQLVFCLTTTTTVYSRVVVQYVERARGLALAIVASGPALIGAVGSYLFNMLVESQGWRTGYHALAIFAFIAGVIALLMIPSDRKAPQQAASANARPRKAREDYGRMAQHPAFWVLLLVLLLISLPHVIVNSQLKLLVMDNGISAAGAAVMLSAFPVGVLAGRLVSGIAIDHVPVHLVAAIGLGLPCIGLYLIATSLDAPIILTLAVLTIGLSYGAEGDIVGVLVVRTFGLGIYSTVLGLLTAVMATSNSLGAALLSLTLDQTQGFDLFLVITGTTVLAGGLLCLFLPTSPETIARPTMAPAE